MIKAVILALALAAPAQAQQTLPPGQAACLATKAGGVMVFTQTKAANGQHIVLAIEGKGSTRVTHIGTWGRVGTVTVSVRWSDGEIFIYDLSTAEPCTL